MIEKIKDITAQVEAAIVENKQHLEDFRLAFLSKKGLILKLWPTTKKRLWAQRLIN